MKLIAIAFLLCLTSCSYFKKEEKAKPEVVTMGSNPIEVKLDTVKVFLLNPAQQKVADDFEVRRMNIIKGLAQEQSNMIGGWLKNEGVDIKSIDNDSLRLGLSPGKISILRKQKPK